MKRILSVLLAALMMLSCLPVMAETAPDPIEFSIFVDHPWFWFDTWGDDPSSRKMTEITGVSFDVTRATDDQQLGLLIAAGDLPDIVYTASSSAITLLSDPEVCYSYNELAEKYGVELYADATTIANNTAADGNYYALRNAYTPQSAYDAGTTLVSPGNESIAYRTDIWEAIGSPEINTLEDLENALIAAKEMYPNVIPLLVDPVYLIYFGKQLGLPGSTDVGYDAQGNAVYGLQVDGVKEYYALLNRFVRKGLIPAETMTYNYDRFCEVRNSGLTFMQLRSSAQAIESNNAALSANTGYTWKLLDHDLSDKYMNVVTGIGWSGTMITKNCKDPKRAIEFISWCRSEEGRHLGSWGIQGEHWDYNENNQTILTAELQEQLAQGKSKSDDFGIGVWIFGDQGDENAFVDYAAADEHQIDQINRNRNTANATKVMSELFFCIPSEGDMLNVFNALNDLRTSEQLKVMYAATDEEFEAAWNNWLAQAETMGMNDLSAWMNEQLVNYKAKLAD